MTRAAGLPLVSIVVIGRNEGSNVDLSLRAAREALYDFGKEGEILYVDSDSQDDSVARARRHEGVRVITWLGGAPSAARARNIGWREALAEFVQFVDGDMELDRHWLSLAIAEIGARRAAAVGGMLRERRPQDSFGNRMFGLDWNGPAGAVRRLGGGALWRRDVLSDLGGFDEALPVGEDPDLSLRAVARGEVLWRLRAPMATHDLGLRGWGDYWRRGVSVGRSYALVARKHPEESALGRIRLRAIGFVVTAGMVALACAWSRWPLAAFCVLTGMSMLRLLAKNLTAGSALEAALGHAVHVHVVRFPLAFGYLREAMRSARAETPKPHLAVLAPELPSISETFVYREAAAIENLGLRVLRFSLRPPRLLETPEFASDPALGRALRQVEIVYRDGYWWTAGAALVRHPTSALRTVVFALRDFVFGRFVSIGARARLPVQLIGGLALSERLRAHRATHLHIHFAHASATVGMYAAKAARIPFSVTGHANDLFVQGSLLSEKVRRARPFLTISEANRNWIAAQTEMAARTIPIQRCGADLRAFHGLVPMVGGPRTVLAVARLVPKKGLDLLLQAIADLAPDYPDLRVHLVGDGPERSALESLARRLRIEDRVRFEGPATRATVLRRLREATVFALPCRKDHNGDMDGIPVALMEAMAAGVPVISTRLSGIPELVRDGETGILVPPDDILALRAALADVLRRPEAAAARVEAARRHVLAEYDLDRQALRLAVALGVIPMSLEATEVPT